MMMITTHGSTFEVTNSEDVAELVANGTLRTPRARDQILADVSGLAVESELIGNTMLAAALRTIVNAARYPVEVKSHLVQVGLHLVEAYAPLAKSA